MKGNINDSEEATAVDRLVEGEEGGCSSRQRTVSGQQVGGHGTEGNHFSTLSRLFSDARSRNATNLPRLRSTGLGVGEAGSKRGRFMETAMAIPLTS